MTWATTLSGDPGPDLPELSSPPPDPTAVIAAWFASADEAGVREARAATLATASPDGVPSTRTVLLLNTPDGRIEFATSSHSRKGVEIAANPNAAITIYWRELLRQITVAGRVEILGDRESDAAFANRPRAAQAASSVSMQGAPLDTDLEAAAAALLAGDADIPRPPDWRAYRLHPLTVELWHGRTNRLHHRVHYERADLGTGWTATRVQP